MNQNILKLAFLFTFGLIISANIFAQVEEEEEDYSMYDDLELAGDGTKRFCSNKITGLSPAKFISVGYDFQSSYAIDAGDFNNAKNSFNAQRQRVNAAHGLRVFANIPVISTNRVIIQMGGNFADTRFNYKNPGNITHALHQTLNDNGLRTAGLNTTIFKPLNEEHFLIFQASADLNGDYTFNDFQELQYLTYSAAGIWGKRVSDYKQWGIGLSRTYRAGELNYIPVLLYNWTSVKKTWGTEILFPARAHLRYSADLRNLFFFGYELEGNSYRINNSNFVDLQNQNYEIRRSELRFRFVYEKQLVGFIWMNLQVGYRVNYLFNADEVPDGNDFYRGFFGTQAYAMENSLTNPLYFNFSLNFVSP